MGLADTAMLGRLDSALFLGGVAIGSNILIFLFWMFSFLRMGTTLTTSQAFGAEHFETITSSLVRHLTLALFLAGLLISLQAFVLPLAVNLITDDEALSAIALNYSHIRIYGAPAVFINYVIIGWFIGMHDTRRPLVIVVFSNVLNIALDYVFIIVAGWQESGAAYATLISEYAALLLGLMFLSRHWRQWALPMPRLSAMIDASAWRKVAGANTELFIRTSMLLLVFNFFTAQSANFGPITLAANTMLMQCALFVAYTLDGYAHAAETMIGKALGSNKLNEFYSACVACTIPALFIAALISVGFFLGRHWIVAGLTTIPEVRLVAHSYFYWLYLLPLVSVWCYILDGIFMGSGETKQLRNSIVLSCFFVFLPLWYFSQALGNHGLWMSFTLFNLARGLILGISFFFMSKHARWRAYFS